MIAYQGPVEGGVGSRLGKRTMSGFVGVRVVVCFLGSFVVSAFADPSGRFSDLSSPVLEVRQAAAGELSRELSRLETSGDRDGLARLMGLMRPAAGEGNPDLEARDLALRVLSPFLAGAPIWQKEGRELPGVPICLAVASDLIAAGGLACPRDEDDDEERGWVGVYDEATGRALWETGPEGLGWPVGALAFSGDALFAGGENEDGTACIARLDVTTGQVTARTRIKRARVLSLNPLPGGGVLAAGLRQVDPEEGWQGRSVGWIRVLDAAGEKTWEKEIDPAAAIGTVHVREDRFWLGGGSGESGWLCAGNTARAPDAACFQELPFRVGAACSVGPAVAVEGSDEKGAWIHLLNSEWKPVWKERLCGPGETVLGMKETPRGILVWGWNGRTDPKWMLGWALDVGMSSWVALHDAATGKRLWRVEGLRDFPGYALRDIPVTARGVLALTRADVSGGERLLMIDPETGRARLDKILLFPGRADAYRADADGRRFYAAGVIVAPDEDGDLDDELGAGGWLGAYRACDANCE